MRRLPPGVYLFLGSRVLGSLVLASLFLASLALQLSAQVSAPPSLKDQLEAQYTSDTVLVVQKEGVLGIAPIILKACPATYRSGNLKAPEPSCYASLKDSSRILPPGEMVNPKEIKVNLQLGVVSLSLVECDTCNKGIPSSSYKAQVDFQFAKGYLEKGNVSEIVDTIGRVLNIAAKDEAENSGNQGTRNLLTNADIIKMASAKLGDPIIMSAIKSEPCCNFDTTVNGMIALKKAGVSDAVIQAMRDAQAAAQSGEASQLNLNGNWIAKGTDSRGSAEVEVDLATQPDGSVTGTTLFHGRVIATIRGTVQGNTFTYTSTGTLPSCPRTVTGTITFDGDTGSGHYEGSDCRGPIQNGTLTTSPVPQANQEEEAAAPAPTSVPGEKSFPARHSHLSWTSAEGNYACAGTLSIMPDGTVNFDCPQDSDPSGKGEQVSFAPGTIKEAKTKLGALHLATKTQGNFDFAMRRGDLEKALAVITPLVAK
jgi:hypothetical protein